MTRGELGVDAVGTLPSVSVAAHELKAPLSLIRQLGLLLGDQSATADDYTRYQQQLVTVADRAIAMVTDITQATAIQASLFPLEPINPLAACQLAAQEIHPVAMLYGHNITLPRIRGKTLIVANRQLLSRVVANFLSNALKYSESASSINIVMQKIDGKLRLGVRDFGPRISSREYRQLLDELGSVKTIRTRPESSGLGIYLASEFAKMMNGRIGMVRHRTGLTFFIELPLSTQMSLL